MTTNEIDQLPVGALLYLPKTWDHLLVNALGISDNDDAAGRLNRIDWLNIFVGATVGYILAVGLPPESIRPFMTNLLHHLFEHRLPQLPIGG